MRRRRLFRICNDVKTTPQSLYIILYFFVRSFVSKRSQYSNSSVIMHSTATMKRDTDTKIQMSILKGKFLRSTWIGTQHIHTHRHHHHFCCFPQYRSHRRRQFYRPWTESKNKLCGIRFFFVLYSRRWQLFDQKCGLNCAIIIIKHSNSSSLWPL